MLAWLHKSFPLKMRFGIPDMYLGKNCAKPGYTMEYGHGQRVPLSLSIRQSETVQSTYHPIMEANTEFQRRLKIHLRWVMIQSRILVKS